MIPDNVINGYLDTLFGHSEPGQVIHHLLTASAGPADHNLLGLPDPDKLQVRIYGIAPDNNVDAAQFIAKTIAGAVIEAKENDAAVYFAGLAVEAHVVLDNGDEVNQNRALRLHTDGELDKHENAVEATRLYAACRDGRRWTGVHILTGVKAGAIRGPKVLSGPLTPGDKGLHPQLIRAAVTPLSQMPWQTHHR